jgi:hypothetical protein
VRVLQPDPSVSLFCLNLLAELRGGLCGLQEDASVPLFCFIGRLEEQKGVDILVDSLAHLKGQKLQVSQLYLPLPCLWVCGCVCICVCVCLGVCVCVCVCVCACVWGFFVCMCI